MDGVAPGVMGSGEPGAGEASRPVPLASPSPRPSRATPRIPSPGTLALAWRTGPRAAPCAGPGTRARAAWRRSGAPHRDASRWGPEEAGLVRDTDPFGATEGLVHEGLETVWGGIPHRLGHLPAALAGERGERAPPVLGQLLAGFPPGEPVGEARGEGEEGLARALQAIERGHHLRQRDTHPAPSVDRAAQSLGHAWHACDQAFDDFPAGPSCRATYRQLSLAPIVRFPSPAGPGNLIPLWRQAHATRRSR